MCAASVEVWGEPTRVPGGVVKFDTGGGGKTLVYFLDPDGVIVELAEYGRAIVVGGLSRRCGIGKTRSMLGRRRRHHGARAAGPQAVAAAVPFLATFDFDIVRG